MCDQALGRLVPVG